LFTPVVGYAFKAVSIIKFGRLDKQYWPLGRTIFSGAESTNGKDQHSEELPLELKIAWGS
jgi:hypothetical protein